MKASQNASGSKAVAFGRNYFHAMGGLTPAVKSNEEGIIVPYYTWENPPWSNSSGDSDGEIAQAVASSQSTIFLTKSGKIYQTGTVHGQIHKTPSPILTKLPLPCVEVSAGRHFCLGRVKGGVAVFSWGAGHFGQLGLGTSDSDRQLTYTPQPMVIQQLLPHAIGSPIKQIAAGDWHGLALTESGRIWAWGSNRSHQCGRKPSSRSSNSQATTLLSPMPIPLDVSAEQIAAGRSHSVAIIKETHQVYCWGSTLHGQCGNVVRKSPVSPHVVDGLSELGFQKISVAGNHTLALTTGGRLFSWGDNSEGQLGHSLACPAQPKAKQVADLDFVAIAAAHELKRPVDQKEAYDLRKESKHLKELPRIVDVFAGAAYSVARSSAGHIYCFGSNDVGQLGIPVPSRLPVFDNTSPPDRNAIVRELDIQVFDSRHILLLPMRNTLVDDMFVETVACGPNHLWCFGRDRSEAESKIKPARTLQEFKKLTVSSQRPDCPSEPDDNIEVAVTPSPKPSEGSSVVDDADALYPFPDLNTKAVNGDSSTTKMPAITEPDETVDVASALLESTLQIQTGPNALADSLTPLDVPTPSTVGEFAGAATPSSARADTFDPEETLSSRSKAKKEKGNRGMGMIRGISAKFRRRFGGKKRSVENSEADLESESATETGHNDADQLK
mmetsp:Transcript_3575/g.7204  ORF Transcript_3575/g.7204 Transcript_3575/m.7204 type:complete len:668 (-) Transcript_3575:46-2049(-)|eukprot:scaffold5111_cov166-Amphora_coffeaeformis.AAC.3